MFCCTFQFSFDCCDPSKILCFLHAFLQQQHAALKYFKTGWKILATDRGVVGGLSESKTVRNLTGGPVSRASGVRCASDHSGSIYLFVIGSISHFLHLPASGWSYCNSSGPIVHQFWLESILRDFVGARFGHQNRLSQLAKQSVKSEIKFKIVFCKGNSIE